VKILLVGWEGADQAAMIGTGRMPSLAQLRRGGRTVALPTPVRLVDPATTWTSLLTGKRPLKHRVLCGEEIAPREMGLRPIRAKNRHAKTVWEIVNESGQTAHAINWPASHDPQLAGPGAVVADLFFSSSDISEWPAELQSLRLSPGELEDHTLSPLLPRPTPPGIAAAMRGFVAAAASIQAVTTFLMERKPADLVAVRFPPVPAALGAIEFLDLMLARLVDLAGPDCAVVLVAINQKNAGMVITRGAGTDEPLEVISPFDLTPTLLSKLGIAPGIDMDGRPNDRLLGPLAPVEPRISWESPAEIYSETEEISQSDDLVRHLFDLGYREYPDRHAGHAVARHRRRGQFHLALAHLEVGEAKEAAEILEMLPATSGSESSMVRSVLAEACFFSGRWRRCRELVENLIADGLNTPLAQVAMAALDAQDGNADGGRQRLTAVEQRVADDPVMLATVAQVYLRMKDESAAQRAILAAIKLEPNLPALHEALGQIGMRRADFESAAREFVIVSAARPDDFGARYRLGIALLRNGQAREAAAALRQSAALDRRGSPAVLRQLAEALAQCGDGIAAEQYRWRAKQLLRFRQDEKLAQADRAAGISR
jgi:tetratricopeptide (TPR) repeat protein